ncbi:MAG TPA: extracellular solute-binding protein [Elusimicrobiales bacterium]|nr:extracellular solute-binding protein [Elusimicrobiales bacterium]
MKIWILSDYDSRKNLAVKNLLARFHAEFPGHKAEFEVLTRRSLWDALFAHLRDPKGSPAAGLIELPQSWTPLFAKLGLLSDLSGLIEGPAARYPDFIRRTCLPAEGGSVYAMPWWAEIVCLHYRADSLKKVSKDPQADLASWDGLLKTCAALKSACRKKDYYPVENSNPSGAVSAVDVLPCVWGRGGDLFSEGFSRCAVTRDETVRGMEDYLSLAARGYMPLFEENFHESGFLVSGLSDLVFSGRQPIQVRAGSRAVHMRPVPYPSSGRPVSPCFVNSLSLCSCAAGEEAPVELLKWLLDPRQARYFTGAFGAFPCHRQPLEDALDSTRHGAMYRKLLENSRLRPGVTAYPTCEILLDSALAAAALRSAEGDYDGDDLRRELIKLQGEIDYLLSIY